MAQAGKDASTAGGAVRYARHRPETTLLYQLVDELPRVRRSDGRTRHSLSSTRFRWVSAPTSVELTHLTHTIAHRVSRFLERQGLLVRDDETAYLSMDTEYDDPMESLIGHSVTYCIATGPDRSAKC